MHSNIVKYTDDKVTFYGNGGLATIKHQLGEDLKNLSRWFEEKELLINLKPGKTELLLFGTSQRIAKINKNFEVKFNNQYNNETKSYKYLGAEVDHTLNLNSYFHKTYKKMTSRLRLLNKLRTKMAAEIWYICSRNLVNIRNQKIYSFVHKVVIGKVGDPFEYYFEFLNTTVNTRNKNILFRLLKLKLEYGRRSTKYLEAKIFNDLPIEVRKHCKENNFNSFLKIIF